MFLKKLEIQGFKTFAERTVLEFSQEGNITAIVGPNGCGKSNIVDAIRWVMGEQSMKQLRGATQVDIIFSGSDSKKALSMAEVCLTFDNTSRMLPIDFSEVSIKRKNYRSGENEYFINKERVRLKDIQELLMDTGIGKGSYIIIGQGQVTQILMSKPEDRRIMFEEAAGINKYKVRKTATKKKLFSTDQNLLRLQDIRSEIHQQLGSLEEQSKKAIEYKEIKDKLKVKEIALLQDKIKLTVNEKDQFQQLVDGYQNQLTSTLNIEKELETEISNIRQRNSSTEETVSNKQSSLEKIRLDMEMANGDIKLIDERISNNQQRLDHSKEEIEQLKENQKLLTSNITQTNEEFTRSEINLKELEEKLQEKTENANEILDQYHNLSQIHNDLIIEIKESSSQIETKKERMHGLTSTEQFSARVGEENSKKVKTLSIKQQEQEQNKTDLIHRKESLEIELSNFKKKKEDLITQKKNTEMKRRSNIEEKTRIKENHDKLTSRYHLLKELQQNFEGLNSGARNILQAAKEGKLSGIKGVVAEMISTDQKHEAIIEQALQNKIQAIVVESIDDATQAIAFLQETGGGRATFLPLDTIHQQETNAEIKDLVKSNHPQLIAYLFGETVITSSLNQAIDKISNSNKIITLAGEYLEKGSISGGNFAEQTTGLLSRQREVLEHEVDIKTLKDKLVSLNEERDQLNNSLAETDSKLETITEQLNRCEIERKTNINDISRIEMELTSSQNEKLSLITDKEKREDELLKIRKQKELLSEEIKKLQSNLNNLNEQLKQKESEIVEIETTKNEITDKLTDIKIESSTAKANFNQLKDKKESLINSLNKNKESIIKKESDLVTNNENITANNTQKEALLSKVPEYTELIEKIKDELSHFKLEKQRLQNDLIVLERKKKDASASDIEIRNNLSKEEIKLAKVEAEIDAISERIMEEYNLTIEEALKIESKIDDFEEAEEEVEKLKRRMKRMGLVNMLAIEEFEAQKERLEFIEDQVSDLEKSKKDLLNLIEDLDKAAEEAFYITFKEINKHFSKIFTVLFNGGEAELVLLDKENMLETGIEIMAKVPGNRKCSLSSLSGGQKALTAIALLFSFLSAKPGPFCFLDEIDAALDDANISRVTKLLKSFAENMQIMIITHRQPTIAIADILFGVTKDDSGVSKLVSVKIKEEVYITA